MKKMWVAVMLVMLAILIYVLHIYFFIEPDKDDMSNEKLMVEQGEKEAENSPNPSTASEVESPKELESVTAQSLLNPQTDAITESKTADEPVYETGMFSWENDAFEPEKLSSFYLAISLLDIDEVYQDFSDKTVYDENAADFARELSLLEVDLYLLTGNSEWVNDGSGDPMIGEIERAAAFRETWGDEALTGIVFDIEPYGSDRWNDGDRIELLENFISGMKKTYNAARDEGLRVILCVPTWYDKHYEEYFKQLVLYCDEISVMNYVREDEYVNMVGEVEYARALDKEITCIFEFQQPGVHELTDETTYYHDGIDAAITSFENLYRDFRYAKLKFAYHYLKPVREILLDR